MHVLYVAGMGAAVMLAGIWMFESPIARGLMALVCSCLLVYAVAEPTQYGTVGGSVFSFSQVPYLLMVFAVFLIGAGSVAMARNES